MKVYPGVIVVSPSTCLFNAWGLLIDARNSASASTLLFTGIQHAVKLKCYIFSRNQTRRVLCNLSRAKLLRIGADSLWSVISSNEGNPMMNCWHFTMAHAALKHSNSITAYLLSALDKNREPTWIILQPPSCLSYNTIGRTSTRAILMRRHAALSCGLDRRTPNPNPNPPQIVFPALFWMLRRGMSSSHTLSSNNEFID